MGVSLRTKTKEKRLRQVSMFNRKQRKSFGIAGIFKLIILTYFGTRHYEHISTNLIQIDSVQ